MGKTCEAIESGQITEPLRDFVSGYNAMAWMLHKLFEHRDPVDPDISDGIHCLFEMQAERLTDILRAAETKDLVLDEYRSKIESMTRAEPAPTPRASALREEFIASKAQEGEDAGDIAAAMNMKRTSIERVISKLQGDERPPARQRAAS